MKLEKALKIIGESKEKIEFSESGFMVDFERHVESFLRSDHFPDKHGGELLISDEQKAWELAEKFAKATGDDIVNIYVVGSNFCPVSDRIIKDYFELLTKEKEARNLNKET